MAEVRARRLVVRGRVQGVFFRASTRDEARRHGVTGWVANRADGSVHAWLEGPADAVETVERWIQHGGPQDAVVDEVVGEDVTPDGHEDFTVLRG